MTGKEKIVSFISFLIILVGVFWIINIDTTKENKAPLACDANCETSSSNCIEDLKNISLSDYKDIVEEGSDAIIMMGFSGCPWCEELSPVLYDVVKAEGLEDMTYYIDCRPDGVKENDVRYSDDGDIMFLKSTIEEFLNEDRQILAPTVIYLNNGKAKGIHVGTLDGHDAAERCLTEDELGELQGVLVAEINEWIK